MKMLRYDYLMREEEEEELFNVYVPYLFSPSGGTYLYNSPATGRGNNGLNVPPLRELCRKLLRDGYLPNVGKVR